MVTCRKRRKPVNTAFHELSNIFNYLKSGGEEAPIEHLMALLRLIQKLKTS
jgi:hypothetical protein